MIGIPECLDFSTFEPSSRAVTVKVTFDNGISCMPTRYIDIDVLNAIMQAHDAGKLPYLAFDEHPKCVERITYTAASHEAIIVTASLSRQELDPENWHLIRVPRELLPPEEMIRHLGVAQYQSKEPLRAGTLSAELAGNKMQLSGADRVSGIVQALRTHRPDVLLTAGYALETDEDLADLQMQLKHMSWPGLVVVEVRSSQSDQGGKRADDLQLSEHCLFTWQLSSGMRSLGRQYFATGEETGNDALISAFEANLVNRTVEFRGRRFGALNCGEINCLNGRNTVSARTSSIEAWLRSLDVVVNPTHDMMGNAGTLKAKRSWTSQGGRAYLSASNWNSRKRVGSSGKLRSQNKSAGTLHSLFINGREMAQASYPTPAWEYREAMI